MEILLAIRYVKVVIALLIKAAITWQCSGIVWLLYDIICVTVLHGFVIPVIERHRILVIDIQVRRVLVQEESARAARRQRYRILQVCVILHGIRAKDGVTIRRLCKWYFITEEWVREEIEVIAIRRLVIDTAVAFVTVQVDQVWIILAIVEAVGSAWVALLE